MTRSASPLDHNEVNMDLMLVNMKKNIDPLISTTIFQEVFILCYLVHLETLAAIYWNSYVPLKYEREKSLDVY